MKGDLRGLSAFVTVAQATGFRDGACASGSSASGLSEAGARLFERLGPALTEVKEALVDTFHH